VCRIRYRAAVYRDGHGPAGGLGPPAAEPRFAAYRELGGDRYREQYGLFFEDCRPGDAFVHRPRRTFLRDEAIAQARRAMEDAPRYHDLDWVCRNEGGRLQVAETFVLAAAATASTRTFGRVSANLGWRNVALPHPVFAGDTVQAESTVTAARPSQSRPGEGVVDVSTRVTNQAGALVLSFDRTLLVHRRGPGGPYEAAGYS
jgi:itaconyl-CoA hydratase